MPTDVSCIRAFFAINLDEATKAIIRQLMLALQKHYPPNAIRWTKPESLHITLQFLKYISPQDLTLLIPIVHSTVERIPSFRITLGPLQLFPTSTHPKIIALGTEPEESLIALSQTLGRCMTEIHFPTEKRLFRGHVTLGRLNYNAPKNSVTLPEPSVIAIPPIKPTEIILFQSQPRPASSHYMALHHFPFGN